MLRSQPVPWLTPWPSTKPAPSRTSSCRRTPKPFSRRAKVCSACPHARRASHGALDAQVSGLRLSMTRSASIPTWDAAPFSGTTTPSPPTVKTLTRTRQPNAGNTLHDRDRYARNAFPDRRSPEVGKTTFRKLMSEYTEMPGGSCSRRGVRHHGDPHR